MSTYWVEKPSFYPVSMVLENLKTGVQTTCNFELQFIDGRAKLSPRSGESRIAKFASDGVLPHEGNKLVAKLPPGTKVVSIDTSAVPAGVASVETSDGEIEKPATGVYVAGSESPGKGAPTPT